MAFFVARRLLYLVPVLIAVSLLTFSDRVAAAGRSCL